MTKFVYRNGKVVDKRLVQPQYEAGPAPNVISDTMSELRHMSTGKYHTSKAAFRADTRASGCIEVGNDSVMTRPRKNIPLDRRERVDAIKRTIYELKNGVRR